MLDRGLASPSGLALAGAAGTAWPSATPFEPSAGLEGFEEENRLWWQRYRDAAARGATFKEEIAGDGGADEAIRRTEDENMPRPGEGKDGGLGRLRKMRLCSLFSSKRLKWKWMDLRSR